MISLRSHRRIEPRLEGIELCAHGDELQAQGVHLRLAGATNARHGRQARSLAGVMRIQKSSICQELQAQSRLLPPQAKPALHGWATCRSQRDVRNHGGRPLVQAEVCTTDASTRDLSQY